MNFEADQTVFTNDIDLFNSQKPFQGSVSQKCCLEIPVHDHLDDSFALKERLNDIINLLDGDDEIDKSESEKRESEEQRGNKNLGFLRDVVAYVEVRSGSENRSLSISSQLEKLGAKVETKLTKDVTHVVFREGKKSTKDKALKRKLHLVSVLWVENCKLNGTKVSEDRFPAMIDEDRIVSSLFGSKQKSMKKPRSKQPKDFELHFSDSSKKIRSILNRLNSTDDVFQPNTDRFATTQKRLFSHNHERQLDGISDRYMFSPPSRTPLRATSYKKCQKNIVNGTAVDLCRRPNNADERKHVRDAAANNSWTKKQVKHRNNRKMNCDEESRSVLNGSFGGGMRCSAEKTEQSLDKDFNTLNISGISVLPGQTVDDEETRADSVEIISPGERQSVEVITPGENMNSVEIISPSETVGNKASVDSVEIISPPESDKKSSSSSGRQTEDSVEVIAIIEKVMNSVEIILPSEANGISRDPIEVASASEKPAPIALSGNPESSKICVKYASVSKAIPGIATPVSTRIVDNPPMDHSARSNLAKSFYMDPNEGINSNGHTGRNRQMRSKNGQRLLDQTLRPSTSSPEVLGEIVDPSNACNLTDMEKALSDIGAGLGFAEKLLKRAPKLTSANQMSKSFTALPVKRNFADGSPSSSKTTIKRTKKMVTAEESSLSQTSVRGNGTSSAGGAGAISSLSKKFRALLKPRESVFEFQLPEKENDTANRTLSFQDVSFRSKDGPIDVKRRKTLVVTSLHTAARDLVQSAVRRLGVFKTSSIVVESTTHVICGEKRRTMSILRGVAQGCWILSIDWIIKSIEAGHWIEEEPYELNYYPAIKISRQNASLIDGIYCMDILSSVGLIFVDARSSPPQHELRSLITICNGKFTMCQRKAAISIGVATKGIPSVTEKWLLDSITEHRLMPLEEYPLLNTSLLNNVPEK